MELNVYVYTPNDMAVHCLNPYMGIKTGVTTKVQVVLDPTKRINKAKYFMERFFSSSCKSVNNTPEVITKSIFIFIS